MSDDMRERIEFELLSFFAGVYQGTGFNIGDAVVDAIMKAGLYLPPEEPCEQCVFFDTYNKRLQNDGVPYKYKYCGTCGRKLSLLHLVDEEFMAALEGKR